MEQAIPILRVDDASAAQQWYARLNYIKEWEFDSSPAFVCIARNGGSRLFLSEHDTDASPDTLIYLEVDDLSVVGQAFVDAEVREFPWARELHLTDLDGNRLRVGETVPR